MTADPRSQQRGGYSTAYGAGRGFHLHACAQPAGRLLGLGRRADAHPGGHPADGPTEHQAAPRWEEEFWTFPLRMVDMTDYKEISTAEIETRLVALGFDETLGGRAIEARKSALRAALRLRERRGVDPQREMVIERATAIVNELRPADAQILPSEMNAVDAACIVENPAGWAPLFCTDAELEEPRR